MTDTRKASQDISETLAKRLSTHQLIWLEAYHKKASMTNVYNTAVMAEFADDCLTHFKERFS